ncbi:MAG: hypothetical protein JXR21_00840 [Candidatus Marinimicrobia bacterium]|nr:hypothetical protein [Candidatus Neomarinimicrobiota bacterium]
MKLDWIDFSTLDPGRDLPASWTYTAAETVVPAEAIARKRGALLLTMRRDAVPAEAVYWVRDHINVSGYNPLRGHNEEDHGVRFPDMSHPYACPPALCGEEGILIRAGQNPEHPVEAAEAAEIVYQTILAKHQGKTVYALICGSKINAHDILKIIQGEDHA